jgi:hypothetical protein
MEGTMSAPNTDVEKQGRRHLPALGGITAAIAVATVLLLGYLFILAERGGTPGESGPAVTAPAPDVDG